MLWEWHTQFFKRSINPGKLQLNAINWRVYPYFLVSRGQKFKLKTEKLTAFMPFQQTAFNHDNPSILAYIRNSFNPALPITSPFRLGSHAVDFLLVGQWTESSAVATPSPSFPSAFFWYAMPIPFQNIWLEMKSDTNTVKQNYPSRKTQKI